MYTATDPCNNTQNVSVTKEHPVYYVEIIGLPLLILLCTVGNILNIIVIASERPYINAVHIVSKSTKVFLLAISISDVCLLWLQVPSYVADYIQNITYFDRSPAALGFKQFYGVQQWGSAAFMQFSDWVLIAFSIDRLRSFHHFTKLFQSNAVVSVTFSNSNLGETPDESPSSSDSDFPAKSRLYASVSEESAKSFRRRTTGIIVVFLFIISLVFTVEYGVYFFYVQTHLRVEGAPRRPQWLSDWNFYQTLLDVAMTVIKFAALLVINIHLIVILISQRGRLDDGNVRLMETFSKNSRRQSREKTGTHLVIGCLVVYFLTHLPYMVVQCLRLASSPPYCLVFIPWDAFTTSRPLIKTLLFFNYSVNFLLYFALSRKFRDQLRLLPDRFRKWRKRNRWKLSRKLKRTNQLIILQTTTSESSTASVTTILNT